MRTGMDITLVGIMLGAAGTPVLAQHRTPDLTDEAQLESRDPEVIERRRPILQWEFEMGGEYRDESSLDQGDGDIESWVVGLALSTNVQLNPEVRMGISAAYVFEQFDFNGTSGFGALNPWENVHTFEASLRFQWEVTNDVGLFAGPVAVLSFEDGGDVAESIEGGGFFGTTYRVSDDLVIGIGLGITNELERDFEFFPVPIVQWRISDTMRLTSSNYAIRRGIEFQYDILDDVTIGAGVAFASRRFRLDDDGLGPGGVGEVEKFPVYGSVNWRPTPAAEFALLAGLNFAGSVDFLDDGGNTIGASDFDEQLFIGINASIRW